LTFAIASLLSTASQAIDIAVGTILAYDRDANRLVMIDRSVWSLEATTSAVPDELAAGDRVQFIYASNEDGVARIREINILRGTSAPGDRNTAKGEVLAYDREARLLVFDDKTAWPLHNLQTRLPFGLDAGDRVEIGYESDEDGVLTIYDIRILAD
jgi:hypothetical protein